MGAAPQGTQASGMYCVAEIVSNQNVDFALSRAHGGVVWDRARVKVMVWNEVTDYANLGSASDRLSSLLDAYAATTGGYDFYSLQVRSVEERIVETGGAIFLGVGYEFVCFAQKSGQGYVEASKSYLAFGPNGGEYNFTGSVYTIDFGMVHRKHEETRVDEVVARPLPQALEYGLVVTAPFTAAVDAAFFGQIKLTGRSLVWGPAGNAAGQRKYTSLGAYLAEYRHISPELGPVAVKAVIAVNGDLTQGTF